MNKLYALYDLKVGAVVGGLHLFRHHAAAIRFFGDLAADGRSTLSLHVDDFHLVCLGEFDDELPLITPMVHPELVLTGAQWAASQSSSTGAANVN